MNLLEELAALPTTQPTEVWATGEVWAAAGAPIVMIYPLLSLNEPARLVVVFSGNGAAATIEDPAPPGWWLDSATWEKLTNELWRLAGGHEAGIGREEVDEPLDAFRRHLESHLWLIRLMIELDR